MDGISVSDAYAKAGSPKAGDMIARNPENHEGPVARRRSVLR